MGKLFNIDEIESTLVTIESLPRNPFHAKDWSSHLYACFDEFISAEHFQTIHDISAKHGHSKVLNILSYENHEEGRDNQGNSIVAEWKIPFSWSEYERIVRPSYWSHHGLYIWPERRTWAIVTTTLEYNVIGGNPEFIAAYEAAMGGRDVIAKEFYENVTSGFVNQSPEGADSLLRNFYPEFSR